MIALQVIPQIETNKYVFDVPYHYLGEVQDISVTLNEFAGKENIVRIIGSQKQIDAIRKRMQELQLKEVKS